MLPEALCDLPCLELIDASHNELAALPARYLKFIYNPAVCIMFVVSGYFGM